MSVVQEMTASPEVGADWILDICGAPGVVKVWSGEQDMVTPHCAQEIGSKKTNSTGIHGMKLFTKKTP